MKFESGNPNLNDGFEYDDDHILLFTDCTKIVSIDQQFKMINRRTMKTGHVNYY